MSKSETRPSTKKSLSLALGTSFAILLVTSIFLIQFFWLPEQEVPNEKDSAEVQSTSDEPQTTASSSTQTPDRKVYYAWFETDQTAIERPEDVPSEAAYVSFNGEYEKWLIGSPVVVAIPQTKKRYRAVVDRIEIDDFGNNRIFAEPDSNEDDFSRLILTVSDGQTLAYVSTEQGSYELTGTDEGGWLIPTRVLQANIDTTKKDVLGTLRNRHLNTKYVPTRED